MNAYMSTNYYYFCNKLNFVLLILERVNPDQVKEIKFAFP